MGDVFACLIELIFFQVVAEIRRTKDTKKPKRMNPFTYPTSYKSSSEEEEESHCEEKRNRVLIDAFNDCLKKIPHDTLFTILRNLSNVPSLAEKAAQNTM